MVNRIAGAREFAITLDLGYGERVSLRIDGEIVEEFTLFTTAVGYFYSHDREVTAEQIQIEFVNDLFDPAAGIEKHF